MSRVKIMAIALVLATLSVVGLTLTEASAQVACNGCTGPFDGSACYGAGGEVCVPFIGTAGGYLLRCTSFRGTYGWRVVGRC